MKSLNFKKVLSLICMISILLLSFGCGESEQEKLAKAKLGASIAPDIIGVLSLPMTTSMVIPMYIINGSATKKDVEQAKTDYENTKKVHEMLKKHVPKKISLLKGWDDFYSESVSLFDEAEDLMEDFYELILKSHKGKNISKDLKDYRSDVDKYFKKVEKVQKLYSPSWNAYAH